MRNRTIDAVVITLLLLLGLSFVVLGLAMLGGCGRGLILPSVPVPSPSVPGGDPPKVQPPPQLRGTLARGYPFQGD